MKLKKIIFVYLILLILIFFVSCKKKEEQIDFENIDLMFAKEDFYYLQAVNSEEQSVAFNFILRSNVKFKVVDIKNVQLPEIDDKFYFERFVFSSEFNKYYFYSFVIKFDKDVSKKIKITKLKFDLFDKTYILPIGTRTIEAIDQEEYDAKNAMLGPMFYQTYKAITGFSKYYSINLGNDKNDIIYIKEITLMNEKLKLENILIDNVKTDGIFEIRPNNVHKIMLEFSDNENFSYFTVQSKIKFTYDNQDYEQYLPPSYIGHLNLDDVCKKLANVKTK